MCAAENPAEDLNERAHAVTLVASLSYCCSYEALLVRGLANWPAWEVHNDLTTDLVAAEWTKATSAEDCVGIYSGSATLFYSPGRRQLVPSSLGNLDLERAETITIALLVLLRMCR